MENDEHDHGSADFFEEAAATWDDDPAKVERARNTAQLLRVQLPLKPTDRVLEIGGGTGLLSVDLADTVGSVVISDPAAAMVAQATANIERAGLGDRLSAVRLDLTAGEAPQEKYDGIWSQLALHHVHDVDLLLRRAHDLLTPGGWLAVVELDADPEGAFHAHHDDFAGHHGFDRDRFAEQLAVAGFDDVETVDAGSVERELDASERRSFTMFLAVGHRR